VVGALFQDICEFCSTIAELCGTSDVSCPTRPASTPPSSPEQDLALLPSTFPKPVFFTSGDYLESDDELEDLIARLTREECEGPAISTTTPVAGPSVRSNKHPPPSH